VLDDASSSPSGNDAPGLTVSGVRRLRRLPGFSRVVLEDDSWFPLLSRTTESLGIVPGFFFVFPELEALRSQGWKSYAYALGLDLLARSEAPAFGLRRKLLQRKLPPEAVSDAIDTLLAEGSLDDRRFADAWLRGQLRSKAVSRPALVAGLRRRGVGRAISEAAVSAAFEEQPELSDVLFDRAVEQVLRRRNMTLDRAAQALLRRGFRTDRVARWYSSLQSQQRD
jgi:SOS response regulatory protein OraA/RecX